MRSLSLSCRILGENSGHNAAVLVKGKVSAMSIDNQSETSIDAGLLFAPLVEWLTLGAHCYSRHKAHDYMATILTILILQCDGVSDTIDLLISPTLCL